MTSGILTAFDVCEPMARRAHNLKVAGIVVAMVAINVMHVEYARIGFKSAALAVLDISATEKPSPMATARGLVGAHQQAPTFDAANRVLVDGAGWRATEHFAANHASLFNRAATGERLVVALARAVFRSGLATRDDCKLSRADGALLCDAVILVMPMPQALSRAEPEGFDAIGRNVDRYTTLDTGKGN